MTTPIDSVLDRALPVARRRNAALRSKIVNLAGRGLPAAAFLDQSRRLILEAEPQMERLLATSLLAAYLKPADELLPAAPPQDETQQPTPFTFEQLPLILPASPPQLPAPFGPLVSSGAGIAPPSVPPILLTPGPSEGGEPIRFPLIERAAQRLLERQVFSRTDFDNLDVESRRTAFTVARVDSLETIGRLQDLVSKSAAEGTTLRDFRRGAKEVLEDSPLSDPHLETIFRTNLAANYSVGQVELLDHPLIGDEFPYVLWTSVHDGRVRPDHLAMERSGIGGTAIYRRDDPLIRLVWPPAGYRCRCHVIPITREDAARYGVAEAVRWVETGEKPATPTWVKRVPVKLPPGWVSAYGVAA